ncbi:heterokaryon incompatibility protein 6, OR allele [Colletotrichum spaethianum]|uniref:Heterokaryon incompatibility protein 6, OR allele n=1 Tax=Colletotrichum spaethianum TaxID=700344 RepID=A0AA37LH33_9PEZI|nr:heterokaryon incompatibility protein 6, OR allele [Colletotrichum spaethianum]GKT46199.1 heterokaryon incompatibility protein 6, OR allele [Colletotrichum spaethianum]
MSCELTTWPTQEAPQYHAISYTWGDVSATRCIIINGQQASIGENCFYALTQAYSSRLDDEDECHFWVDSICMNQQDVEKNHQVRKMGNIY